MYITNRSRILITWVLTQLRWIADSSKIIFFNCYLIHLSSSLICCFNENHDYTNVVREYLSGSVVKVLSFLNILFALVLPLINYTCFHKHSLSIVM